MPIHTILGKPGSGKSLYATTLLIRELVDGNKNIVTNLPLHPGRLNEYLQEKHPGLDCRMAQRLRMLTDEELREFWKFRGPIESGGKGPELLPALICNPMVGESAREFQQRFALEAEGYSRILEQATVEWMRAMTCEGDSKGVKGVVYFLDECHIAFNARDWASIGRGALHYLSQHRKLSDVVFPITQVAGNLDKQFRSVSEDFTVLRNMAVAKYGPFRGSAKFVRKTYLHEPSNSNAEPFETASFTLDKEGIASCYDTARGIGVHGSVADKGRRAKGIPIWWVFPMALGLGSLCIAIPWALAKGTARVATAAVGQKIAEGAAAMPASEAARPAGLKADTGAKVEPPKAEPLVCTGYLIRGREITVNLSDGRTVTEGDVLRIDRTGVTLREGGKVAFAKARSVPPPPPEKKAVSVESPVGPSSDYRGESLFPAIAAETPKAGAMPDAGLSSGGPRAGLARTGRR